MTETADAPEPCRRGQRFFPARALRKGGGKVPNYEVVREISNSCARNQMRDVFFSEIETEDPEAYVRREIKGSDLRLEIQPLAEGAVCIYVESAGMFQKFLFTPLDD